jgi:toxin-antitoxin system PIN domain toxin
MFLPDVNVWLALAFDVHLHHPTAKTWYDTSSDTCCFCRMTQQGLLRLASNPAVFKDRAVSLQKAWQIYESILSDPRITFADEPENIEGHWRAFTRRRSFSPNLWNDAYLAGFAKAADFELVTFDRGLLQFKGIRCTILS